MKFSDSEMMFMISVSRGRKPLGIDIKIPEDSQREDYKKDAIYSLRYKNKTYQRRSRPVVFL